MRAIKVFGGFVRWWKTLLRVVRNYDATMSAHLARIKDLENVIHDRTSVGVEISYSRKAESYVIVVGRYKEHDYVQTFSIRHDDLSHLINQLKSMERYGRVETIDCPPAMRSVVKRGLF